MPNPTRPHRTAEGRSWLAVVLALVLVGCAGIDAGAPDATTVLRVGVQGTVTSLDPRTAQGAALEALLVVMEPLLRLSQDRVLAPGLATSWEVAPDGRSIDLALRSGVTFHDGTPFTSEDVRHSLTTLLEAVEEVDTPEPLRAIVRFAEPSAQTLYDLARTPIGPSGDWNAFITQPIGTGPSALEGTAVEWPLRLARFDAYWGERPAFDVVELHEFAGSGAGGRLAEALVAGDLDLFQSFIEFGPRDQLQAMAGVTVVPVTNLSQVFVAANTSVAPLSDRRVRAAIDHLVPRDAIVGELLVPFAPTSTLLGPDTPWSAGAPERAFDPDEATALLTAAGGVDRTLQLYVNEEDAGRVFAANRLAESLNAHGVPVDVTVVTFGELLTRASSGDFDLLVLGVTFAGNPPGAVLWSMDPAGVLPTPAFSNARVTDLADKIKSRDVSTGPGADALRELVGLLANEAHFIHLYANVVYGVHDAELSGWGPHPDRVLALQALHLVRAP